MKELIPLINTFALLSLLAVGGGTAVIPQMEHETVTVHQWVTQDQFTTIYSLGQLAPGPNMTMVALIGFHAAGVLGFILVLCAFYFPSSLLVYVVSHFWDACKDNPWRDSVQKGMAPITIGLMLAGVYAVGKSASFTLERPLWFNSITVGIGIAVVVILFARRINPALLILAGGALGYFVLRLPAT
jgi:chromate transporter